MKLCMMFAVAYLMTFATWGKEIVGFVGSVVDGDTIWIRDLYGQYKVRLAGIDAPELKQAFGKESASQLNFLVGSKEVRVVYTSTDREGRIIGVVYLGNVDINLHLLRNGYAWHYKQYNNSRHYAEAEAMARREGRGLWRDQHPVAPWEFRSGGGAEQNSEWQYRAKYIDYRMPNFKKDTYGGFVQTSSVEKQYRRSLNEVKERDTRTWGDFISSGEGRLYLAKKRLEKTMRLRENGGRDPLIRMSEYERGQYYYNLGRRYEMGEDVGRGIGGFDAVYYYRRAVDETKRKNVDAINALRRLEKWDYILDMYEDNRMTTNIP